MNLLYKYKNMAKLNLNALKKETENTFEIVSADNNTPESINPSTIITIEKTSLSSEWENWAKKKFSLKDLKISNTSKETQIWNITTSSIQDDVIKENSVEDLDEKEKEKPKTKISIKWIVKEKTNSDQETWEVSMKDTQVQILPIISEEKSLENDINPEKQWSLESKIIPSEKKEEKVVTISDGDTSCNIIAEEKPEIFTNYLCTYDSSSKEATDEVIQPEKKVAENYVVPEKEKKVSEETPLTKFNKNSWKTKKQIFIASVSTTFVLIIGSWAYINSTFIKGNIQEVSHNSLSVEPVVSLNEDVSQIQESPTIIQNEKPSPEDKSQEIESIQSQTQNPIESISGASISNKQIENYLLKKYKK